MDKDFMQYVYARIERAMAENQECMRLQSDLVTACKSKDFGSYTEISDELQAKSEVVCYMQGYSDAMRMVLDIK